ncbi:MAG TPA: hypothetical protein VGX03_26650 [Candidatus Binatia bacterium]|nr:hypothetical protein [Candidatus Binatia bacterium]
MVPTLFFYQLGLVVLVCVFLMLCWLWPNAAASPHQPIVPTKPSRRQRSTEPKPFAGLTQRPQCALCEREATQAHEPPPAPPEPMPPTNRRPRTVDTSQHFCPHGGCRYRGWLGLGNLCANGHPSGGPWRQFHCTSCDSYFLETHGTIFHGKQAAVELIVRVLACLAEGLGIRATARVFEVAPNTVLHWLVEAAEQLHAFTSYFLCEVHVQQLQLDELYAVLSAFKGWGDVRSRSDPTSLTLTALGVDGDRSGHQAAPDYRRWGPDAGHGAKRGPPSRPDAGTRLCAALPDRRLQGVCHSAPHSLRPVGAAATPQRQRATPQAALDAAAAAPLCAGGEDGAGAWCGCGTAWCLAHWRPSMPFWRPLAARSTPLS